MSIRTSCWFLVIIFSVDNLTTVKPRLGSLGFINAFQDAIETRIGNGYVFN